MIRFIGTSTASIFISHAIRESNFSQMI